MKSSFFERFFFFESFFVFIFCFCHGPRFFVCQAPNAFVCVSSVAPPKHQMCLHVFACVSPNAFICVSPNALNVCHQMRLYMCHQMRLRSHVFQQSKQEFLSEEHSCLNIDSCLNTDSCANTDSPNTNSWTPKWTRNGPKMNPEWTQNGPKMDPKWTQNGPKMDPKWTYTVTHIQTHLELDTHTSEDHPTFDHFSIFSFFQKEIIS